MDFLSVDFILQAVLLLSVPFVLVYFYFKYGYTYWSRKSVEVLEEPVFPFGNGKNLFLGKESFFELHSRFYKQLKGRFGGVYILRKPVLIVKDPEVIKTITVKDFPNFQDRGTYCDAERDPLSAHLFNLGGPKWKILRQKLSPTFTSGKMKMMFQTIVDCGEELTELLKTDAEKNSEIEVKEFAARYTTDIISSVAFGIQGNTMKNPDAEFRRIGKKIFEIDWRAIIRNLLFLNAPYLIKFLKMKVVDPEVNDFVMNILKETVNYRETNNVTRNDFLQLLIQLKNKGKLDGDISQNGTNGHNHDSNVTDEKITELEMAAQVFVFFVAGFETSSTAMQFCLYELAKHPEIQKKLQIEIDTILKKHNGKLTYEAIQDMEYLDMVISEALRMYPPVGFLNRKCLKDYKLPNSDLLIEKDTDVVISVTGLHYDPKYFPNPEKFDPDRFLTENKSKRNPYCYLPFGEGPRNCIGLRMGKMQTKVGILSVLKKYTVNVCSKTDIPMTYDKRSIVTTSENPIVLKISCRT